MRYDIPLKVHLCSTGCLARRRAPEFWRACFSTANDIGCSNCSAPSARASRRCRRSSRFSSRSAGRVGARRRRAVRLGSSVALARRAARGAAAGRPRERRAPLPARHGPRLNPAVADQADAIAAACRRNGATSAALVGSATQADPAIVPADLDILVRFPPTRAATRLATSPCSRSSSRSWGCRSRSSTRTASPIRSCATSSSDQGGAV